MTNKRSINMKRVSATRSAEVKAMLLLLSELDLGGLGDMNVDRNGVMQHRVNSYRAQKIAKSLGKNVSKSHLIKFAKDKDKLAKSDLNNLGEKKLTVDEFIASNSTVLLECFNTIKEICIRNELEKLD
jgi:hypothetical protein